MKPCALCIVQKCSHHLAPCHTLHLLMSSAPPLGTSTPSFPATRPTSTSSNLLPGACEYWPSGRTTTFTKGNHHVEENWRKEDGRRTCASQACLISWDPNREQTSSFGPDASNIPGNPQLDSGSAQRNCGKLQQANEIQPEKTWLDYNDLQVTDEYVSRISVTSWVVRRMMRRLTWRPMY